MKRFVKLSKPIYERGYLGYETCRETPESQRIRSAQDFMNSSIWMLIILCIPNILFFGYCELIKLGVVN